MEFERWTDEQLLESPDDGTPTRRRRPRRPGWRAALVALACGLLLAAGVYAIRGVRQPEPGNEQVRPTALGVPDPALTGPPGPITPAIAEQLTVALSTNVDPAFAKDFDRFAGRIMDACRQLRHDPPLTEARQVHHVQRQFQEDIDGFDDRDASVLLEVLRGTYCPIAG